MRWIALALAAILLASCAGPFSPYAKLTASNNDLVRPPWEAEVRAGPGAEDELDLETLDGPLTTGSLPAGTSVPAPSEDITAPPDEPEVKEAVVSDTSPAKPAKKGAVSIKAVAVPNVIGAKGKGNGELTAAMRKVLKEAGWPVLAGRRDDALLITGKVTLGSSDGAEQTVKIVWIVAAPDGSVLGQIVQENGIPPGSLDSEWGENAQFATEAAADGIFKLIQKYR